MYLALTIIVLSLLGLFIHCITTYSKEQFSNLDKIIFSIFSGGIFLSLFIIIFDFY